MIPGRDDIPENSIHYRRKLKGWSQKTLAIRIGADKATVHNHEAHKTPVSPRFARRSILKISILRFTTINFNNLI